MAPPTRLRPHLDDLLQKNLELEHVVADLRHQLTQSSAKWADERKTLAVGCDSLMASFAKFRARLDVHPSDWGDSEGEVEQNLDAGRQSEERGEVDNGMFETERDQGSSVAEDLHERCRALAGELRVREGELEESRRKHEAAEKELQHVQRLLDAQSEQLRVALATVKTDTDNKPPPERTPDDTSARANPSSGLENTLEKLDFANQEISRLKLLLQEWKKYGSDWKRDAQIARARGSELQLREHELSAQVKAADESRALLETEIRGLTSALADQTAAVEDQRTACQESVNRVHDLEAMVALLRAQLSPEQLASFDSEQNQPTAGPSSSTQSPTPHADTNANKRSDMIVLKIPYHAKKSIRKPSAENNGRQDEQTVASSSQQSPATRSPSIPVSSVPQKSNNALGFNPSHFEVCIHTCNPLLCRNDSRSFLWPRRQPSLPRHVLSTHKHYRCTPDCPGHRLLNMPLVDAMKEPRRAKCRPPTEAELALAAEEARRIPPSERADEAGTGVEGIIGNEGSGEPEEPEEPEGGPTREEEVQERGEGRPSRTIALSAMLGKRLRSRITDGEEPQRAMKRRSRISK